MRWENRYEPSLVDRKTCLLRRFRHIELDRVRAGRVADAGGCPWSSFSRNALDAGGRLILPDASWLALGSSTEERQAR
jgi:hypothetical protein